MTNSLIKRLEYGQISELGKKYKQKSIRKWDKQISFKFHRNSPDDVG